MVNVEICIDCRDPSTTAQSARAAQLGGARTIELCSAMAQDGLTPSVADIVAARAQFRRPGLMVMVRPRGGGFVYDSAEIAQIKQQITLAANAGADGIVLGTLNPNGQIALETLRDLVTLSHQHQLAVTFHRAFDATPDPAHSLEQLIALGVSRVLTSGTRWGSGQSALHGTVALQQTIEQADGRIEIVIGGGVASSNAQQLLAQLGSNKTQVALHAYSSVLTQNMTDAAKVAKLVEAATFTSK